MVQQLVSRIQVRRRISEALKSHGLSSLNSTWYLGTTASTYDEPVLQIIKPKGRHETPICPFYVGPCPD